MSLGQKILLWACAILLLGLLWADLVIDRNQSERIKDLEGRVWLQRQAIEALEDNVLDLRDTLNIEW